MAVLTPEELRSALMELPGWAVENGRLVRHYVEKSFAHALLFVNAIGQLAEAADHHPDLQVEKYKHVTVRLVTHSANGLTNRDVALAAQIEALPHKA